ncbi:MAG TPA: hypothetical protein VHA30_04455 [Patescibacteria group bacterium]|nr:hypothetical protein [Patescibacteria group bacterium]
MNKKAIAILGAIFLLIVGTLGFLIYSKYAANKTSAPAPVPAAGSSASGTPDNTAVSQASSTPIASQPSGAVQLTADQVVSPALFYNGSGIAYFDKQGNLYQAALDSSSGQLQLTNKKQLDIPAKAGITKILWPQRSQDYIAQITDASGKISWSYFNSTTQTYTDLPPQVEAVSWLPNGTQVMYIWVDNGKATLNIGNPDTTNWQYLADMWETDDALFVSPDGSQALYYETDATSTSNAINSVTSDGKIWKGLVKSGFNLGISWSPDGQKFLFGKKDINSQSYQLWIYNMTSGEVKNLGLYTTPDKTTWASDSNAIYAAVPASGQAGSGNLTQDAFYRLDTTTLDKKQYSSGSTPLDGEDLFLTSAGDRLVFKNAQDGGLYYLDLSQ